MLTHEIEARKRLHDHVMEESDRRHRSRSNRKHSTYCTILCMYVYIKYTYIAIISSARAVQSSLLSHSAPATIRPARFVRMRTFSIVT